MKTANIPIDQAGRIVLPKQIREELAVRPGDTFDVSVNGSSITLTPNRERAGFVRKGKALVFGSPGNQSLTQKAVDEIVQKLRAERDEKNIPALRQGKRNG